MPRIKRESWGYGDAPVKVYEWEVQEDGRMKFIQSVSARAAAKALAEALDPFLDSVEYAALGAAFRLDQLPDEFPPPRYVNNIACHAYPGSNEGYRVEVDLLLAGDQLREWLQVHHLAEKFGVQHMRATLPVVTAVRFFDIKHFLGMDFSWFLARECARMMGAEPLR